MVRMLTAAAAMTIAGSAMAVPQGSYWQMVDNSGNIAGSAGIDADFMTFDLYLALEAGDVVAAIDFGISGGPGNIGISTDGTFFDGGNFGGDSVADNVGFAGLVPNLEYHPAVTVNGGAISFAQAMDFNESGVTGAWFVNPQQLGTGGPNGPDDMWVARITVSNQNAANDGLTEFLGGTIFAAGTGPNGNFGLDIDNIPLGLIDVPNAKIPTPGALALFGLAGAAATRRRR